MPVEIVFGSKGFIGHNYLANAILQNTKHFEIPDESSFIRFLDNPLHFEIESGPNIVWLSGKVNPTLDPVRNKKLYDSDLRNLQETISVLKHLNWVGRFIFLSSGGCIYSEKEGSIKESDDLFPNNAYGYLKLKQEQEIYDSGLNYAILRVANVFGRKINSSVGQNVIDHWITSFNSDKPCKVFGSLNSFRDYVNVLDVVSAIIRSSRYIGPGVILNIGSGIKTTMNELMHLFEFATQRNVNFDFESPRSSDRLGYCLNIEMAFSVLGWSPSNSSHSDIRKFFRKEINSR